MGEIAQLRDRLAEAEEMLRAIRNGEVDTIVGVDKKNRQVFTLQGAEYAYRLLIESMNEGALTLTKNKTILYANQCFAKMVKCPLEQVIGASFRFFLSIKDTQSLQTLLKRSDKKGSKIQVLLNAVDGSETPALISIRPLAMNSSQGVTIGMVVTDMTEARRNEELLRGLSHRIVQAQEFERGRVSIELHDNITQLLCAALVCSQVLANKLSKRYAPAQKEALKLCDMLGQSAKEVERISRNLRPSGLNELGLGAVLRSDSTEFIERTGIDLKLTCAQLTASLPAAVELTFYRIFQEALQNVQLHAAAKHVRVSLRQQGRFIELMINDDGVGFDTEHQMTGRKGNVGFGLLHMRERVEMSGGSFTIHSVRDKGTTIQVKFPFRSDSKRRERKAYGQ